MGEVRHMRELVLENRIPSTARKCYCIKVGRWGSQRPVEVNLILGGRARILFHFEIRGFYLTIYTYDDTEIGFTRHWDDDA
jgi:hypothetical protein